MAQITEPLPAAEILVSPQGAAVLIPDGLKQPIWFRVSADAFTVLSDELSPIAELALTAEQQPRLARLGAISCVAVDEEGPTRNYILRRAR